ncbi:hypothetical protein P691DRAFT_765171 [Macrolepiota fuliginosa MF-IS2]|uniref:Uncharacterized protein n=1 Tax=Macrolepiota fuliginosa MF-IS2 TaxID=1400762 RepID=A0A9P5X1W9_9AGAR|nr:hypothetical protein P691DRAFT_765171 [Macrolepiota fuliginosa MF-IS2]
MPGTHLVIAEQTDSTRLKPGAVRSSCASQTPPVVLQGQLPLGVRNPISRPTFATDKSHAHSAAFRPSFEKPKAHQIHNTPIGLSHPNLTAFDALHAVVRLQDQPLARHHAATLQREPLNGLRPAAGFIPPFNSLGAGALSGSRRIVGEAPLADPGIRHSPRKSLHYAHLPSEPDRGVVRKEIYSDETIIDTGLGVYGRDPLAIIATQPAAAG